MDYEENYDILKKIDKKIAEDYLFTKAKNKALEGILKEVKLLLKASTGESVLELLKQALGPVSPENQDLISTEIILSKTRKRASSYISKQQREEVKQRLIDLGEIFSPKDSSQRLLDKLNRIENSTDWVRQLEEPLENKTRPQNPIRGLNTSNNNIVNGW